MNPPNTIASDTLVEAKGLIFKFILAPLIRRDQRLRIAGKRPDRWYWADLLAIRWGLLSRDDYPTANNGKAE